MLSITKKEIYYYAFSNNICFLWDSTPSWSQRGKIRDNVKPALEAWNNDVVDGLFEISSILTESLELINELVELAIIKINDNKLIYKNNVLTTNNLFWKTIFQCLKIKCTSRSLDTFTNVLKKIKTNFIPNKTVKYNVNKDFQLKIICDNLNNVSFFFK
jgi:tRNA(Ile)-lysidine synthase TilS/MesJ